MKNILIILTSILLLSCSKPVCPCEVVSIRRIDLSESYYSITIKSKGIIDDFNTRDNKHYIGEIVK